MNRKNKTLRMLIISYLILMSQLNSVMAQGNVKLLQVYLPREITVKDNVLNLGDIGIVRGQELLVAKANEISLGKFSVPGQEIIISRNMVLSRLACSEIPASKVNLTGAEKTIVKQQHKIIRTEELINLASSYLKKNSPDSSIFQFDCIRQPKDLILPGFEKEIELNPSLVKSPAKNQAKVHIDAYADGRLIGSQEVTFLLKYKCRQAVTLSELLPGTLISPSNVKIEEAISNNPEPLGWSVPYGLVARRRMPADTVIRTGMAGPAKPAVIIKRNQNVVIRIDMDGLLVTAMGKSMQDGRTGEYIKVKNIDSQRIILVKVKDNGTVEPIF